MFLIDGEKRCACVSLVLNNVSFVYDEKKWSTIFLAAIF